MQEEIERRTVALVVTTARLTAHEFRAATQKYLTYVKQNHQKHADVHPKGKQTVKQLVGQNQGVSNITLDGPDIKEFERIARKFGVDYAVKKQQSDGQTKFLIFFKGRDGDVINAALEQFLAKELKKDAGIGILEQLHKALPIEKETKKVLER